MTEKAFYQDSYQKTLTSEVVEVLEDGLLLAATIFYPLGGGQPGDRGTLSIGGRDYTVVDTRYADDRHNIVHYLETDDLTAIRIGDRVYDGSVRKRLSVTMQPWSSRATTSPR